MTDTEQATQSRMMRTVETYMATAEGRWNDGALVKIYAAGAAYGILEGLRALESISDADYFNIGNRAQEIALRLSTPVDDPPRLPAWEPPAPDEFTEEATE